MALMWTVLLSTIALAAGQDGSTDTQCVSWVVSTRRMGTMWKHLEGCVAALLCLPPITYAGQPADAPPRRRTGPTPGPSSAATSWRASRG